MGCFCRFFLLPCCHVATFYLTKTTKSFSAISGVWYGTITLVLNNSVVVSILLITRYLESVETGLSHLNSVNPFSPSCIVEISQLEPTLFIEQVWENFIFNPQLFALLDQFSFSHYQMFCMCYVRRSWVLNLTWTERVIQVVKHTMTMRK